MSKKKEDLLHTSEILFYDHGFHSIGLKKIVTESGIAMMTLYNHFASKEELIMNVLQRREDRYMDHLNFFTNLLDEGTSHSAFVRIAVAHCRWLNDYASKGCLFLRAKEEYGATSDHPIVVKVNEHKYRLKQFIQSSDTSRSPEEVISLCLLLEGATALSESENTDTVVQQTIKMAERLFG
ncbi:TetR/AcrR family transcriptional regulator [Saccharibacillus sp. JS10]|uniref:TetR/AcrR family transcriptional regulator n=1 Tax=Saccharibacillus sp. JS10 TaxID=2950552 RepID=UPI002108F7D7|nr:TetR/AcrR family transcriptional regulator [Saccharibacillus sp. JS10]MCQ4086513.1 TetR/AcrR family transcriptional regulator [Saccharibacillus sp. JS10]